MLEHCCGGDIFSFQRNRKPLPICTETQAAHIVRAHVGQSMHALTHPCAHTFTKNAYIPQAYAHFSFPFLDTRAQFQIRKIFIIQNDYSRTETRSTHQPRSPVQMNQVLSAVAYLHHKGVVHRDIKACHSHSPLLMACTLITASSIPPTHQRLRAHPHHPVGKFFVQKQTQRGRCDHGFRCLPPCPPICVH